MAPERRQAMRGRARAILVSLPCAGLLAACFGSPDVTQPGGNQSAIDSTRFMSAAIDGSPWATSAITLTNLSGTVRLLGIKNATSPNAPAVVLGFKATMGQHQLGPQFGVDGPGEYGQVGVGPPTMILWTTGDLHIGIVNVTELTETSVAGTFEFDAVAATPAASPQIRRVTGGAFRVRF